MCNTVFNTDTKASILSILFLLTFHLSISNSANRKACVSFLTGRPVRSDLANYSDHFLFIISHSRESPWTIKPRNVGLHIHQWNIIC